MLSDSLFRITLEERPRWTESEEGRHRHYGVVLLAIPWLGEADIGSSPSATRGGA